MLPLAAALATCLYLGAGTGTAAGQHAGAHSAAREPCVGEYARPGAANAATIDAATLCLINGLRRADHMAALQPNRELQRVALAQVREMVRRDYFADVSPSGITPGTLIESTSYARHASVLVLGENIGWGTGADTTPAYMVGAWLRSPPHRRLIFTSAFRDAGVGATPAAPWELAHGEAGATYALELGRR